MEYFKRGYESSWYRPPLEREVAEYTNYDKQRLMVKPGATGLWQVGERNDVSFDQMVNLDLNYIKKLSTLNDFKIILKTVLIMFFPNNAY